LQGYPTASNHHWRRIAIDDKITVPLLHHISRQPAAGGSIQQLPGIRDGDTASLASASRRIGRLRDRLGIYDHAGKINGEGVAGFKAAANSCPPRPCMLWMDKSCYSSDASYSQRAYIENEK